jgi:hypothetical protein
MVAHQSERNWLEVSTIKYYHLWMLSFTILFSLNLALHEFVSVSGTWI